MTQVEMAEKLGVNQSVVSEYERGEVRLHGALVVQLAKILKVSTDEILGLEKLKSNGPVKDRRLLRLIHEIDALSRREKDTLLKTISNYLKGSRAS